MFGPGVQVNFNFEFQSFRSSTTRNTIVCCCSRYLLDHHSGNQQQLLPHDHQHDRITSLVNPDPGGSAQLCSNPNSAERMSPSTGAPIISSSGMINTIMAADDDDPPEDSPCRCNPLAILPPGMQSDTAMPSSVPIPASTPATRGSREHVHRSPGSGISNWFQRHRYRKSSRCVCTQDLINAPSSSTTSTITAITIPDNNNSAPKEAPPHIKRTYRFVFRKTRV